MSKKTTIGKADTSGKSLSAGLYLFRTTYKVAPYNFKQGEIVELTEEEATKLARWIIPKIKSKPMPSDG